MALNTNPVEEAANPCSLSPAPTEAWQDHHANRSARYFFGTAEFVFENPQCRLPNYLEHNSAMSAIVARGIELSMRKIQGDVFPSGGLLATTRLRNHSVTFEILSEHVWAFLRIDAPNELLALGKGAAHAD